MKTGSASKWAGLAVVAGIAIFFGMGSDGRASAGGGGCHGTPASERSGDSIELTGNCFSPTVLNVAPGTAVTFENLDSVKHDIAGVAGGWGTQGQTLSQGGSATVTFTEPGLYPYSCYLHYGMTGVISVGAVRTAGGSPGDTSVSRAPGAEFEFQENDGRDVVAAKAEDSKSEVWMAGGGLLVGAMVVSGAWAIRSRR